MATHRLGNAAQDFTQYFAPGPISFREWAGK